MKYYIFKVTNNKGKTYYKLNNAYLGYIDFDSDFSRSKLEHRKNIEEVSYQIFAEGEVEDDFDLHLINCASERFDLREAKKIAAKYALNISNDHRKYEVVSLDKNSSNIIVREIGGKATIK